VLVGCFEGVEDVEGGHDVKRVRLKRRSGHGRAREAGAPRLAANGQAHCREIEAVRPPETAQKFQIGACATATVEQSSGRYPPCRVVEQGRDETPETAKPEMARFGAGGGAQQVLHAPDCSRGRPHDFLRD
jgi:hypothetical protein